MNQKGHILISILILCSLISLQLSSLTYVMKNTRKSLQFYRHYLTALYPSLTGLNYAIKKCPSLPLHTRSSKEWIYKNLPFFLHKDLGETQLYFYKTEDKIVSIAIVNDTYRHIKSVIYTIDKGQCKVN